MRIRYKGSHITTWLTENVEGQILKIFEEMNRRGGVLGSLEVNYQRNRIQDESMVYEHRKHTGDIPIIGVNTFQDPDSKSLSADEADSFNLDVTRSDSNEKKMVILRNEEFRKDMPKKRRWGSSA